MKTISEESKHWSRQRLRTELLMFIDHWNAFEAFLIRELGRETYMDLSREFALEKSERVLEKLGMSKEQIEEFASQIGNVEQELKA